MSVDDLKQEIFKYRTSLIAQGLDFEINDPSLTPSQQEHPKNSQENDSYTNPTATSDSTINTTPITNTDAPNFTNTKTNPDTTTQANPPMNDTPSNNEKPTAHFVQEPSKPALPHSTHPVTPPRTPKIQSTNVNKYTSEKRGNNNSVFPQKQHESKTASFEQYIISIRAKFYREYAKLSISELAQICISLVREVDGSMLVLALSGDIDEEIDNENLFPNDDDGARKYLAEISEEKWCKKFLLRCKVSASTKSISNNIISYMAQNKQYAKVDKLSANRVSCIGFMNTLHPYRHNRSRLANICEKHIKNDTGRAVQLNVLPRGLSAGKGQNLVESHFVAIEVASDDAQVVSTSLMAEEFIEYNNCRFVPLTKYDDNYEQLLHNIIQAHRQICLDTNFVTVNDLNIEIPVRLESTTCQTIKEVLMSTNDAENPLIYDIDVAPNGATNIIYNVNADDQLEKYLNNISSLLSTHIHPDDISAVYQNTAPVRKILNKRRVTQFEKNHIAELQAMYRVNPQDPPDAPPSKPSVTLPESLRSVSKPVTPFGTASYLKATTQASTSPSKQQKLESARLSNIETSVASMQDKFLTADEVREMINKSKKETIHTEVTMTPKVVQSLIDKTLNGQPLHALLDPNFDSELDTKISVALGKINIPAPMPETKIQEMIDTSMTASNKVIHEKIDKMQESMKSLDAGVAAQVQQITTSFATSVAAFTAQSQAILAALNKEPQNTPAIRIKKEDPGAKTE